MKSHLTMFGIDIDVEVSGKKKRRKWKRVKALSAPRKHRMVQNAPVIK